MPDRHRHSMLLALIASLLLANGLAGLRITDRALVDESLDRQAVNASERLLRDFVEEDGRVVRQDHGDTVSEGQAYAMLVAVALDDEDVFDLTWGWTTDNLRRDDGLFGWRWEDGDVVDWDIAPDAELDIISALLLASDRFDRPDLADDALWIAGTLVGAYTVDAAGGQVLLAGDWALEEPHVINPSYLDVRTMHLVEERTGDGVWDEVRRASYVVIEDLVAGSHRLPPDWAELRDDEIVPIASEEAERPWYAWDAARVPVRLALDCDRRGREIAAGIWSLLERNGELGSAIRDLDGPPVGDARSAVAAIGAAAAAHAAGDHAAVIALLDLAEEVEAHTGDYYDAAWVALGRIHLTTDRLGACP